MTTTSMTHPFQTIVAAASGGLVAALLSVTPSNAHAIPDPIGIPAVVDGTAHNDGHRVERNCFITPPSWNVALDGHMPRCYTNLR